MRIGKLNEQNQLISSFTVVDGLINTTIFIGDNWVSNPTVKQMESIGYKPINDGVIPTPQDGYYILSTYSETEIEILVSYSEVVIPPNPFQS